MKNGEANRLRQSKGGMFAKCHHGELTVFSRISCVEVKFALNDNVVGSTSGPMKYFMGLEIKTPCISPIASTL